MEIELVKDFSSFVPSSGLDSCNFLHAVTGCPLQDLSSLQDSTGDCNQLRVHFRTQAVLLQAG